MMEISHHGLRQAVGIPLLCAGVGFTLWSFVRSMRRIQQVNEMLPPEEQFYEFWWGPEKKMRFDRTYKNLFPGDKGLWKDSGLMLLGVALDGLGLWFFFQ
jgi:hypothetical protein